MIIYKLSFIFPFPFWEGWMGYVVLQYQLVGTCFPLYAYYYINQTRYVSILGPASLFLFGSMCIGIMERESTQPEKIGVLWITAFLYGNAKATIMTMMTTSLQQHTTAATAAAATEILPVTSHIYLFLFQPQRFFPKQ